MSWHYSRALEEVFSRAGVSGGEPSARWSGIVTASKLYSLDKMTIRSNRSKSGTTSLPLTDVHGVTLLTSSPQDSRVNLGAKLAGGAAKATNETCGRTPFGPFLTYDRDASSWRMSSDYSRALNRGSSGIPSTALCLGAFGSATVRLSEFCRTSLTYSGSWPTKGLMLRGRLFRQEKPERLTFVGGSGYGQSIPTPTVADSRNSRNATSSSKTGKDGTTLSDFVWPTPDAGTHNLFGDPEVHQKRLDRLKRRGYNANGAGIPLGMAVRYPTPKSTRSGPDFAREGRPGSGGDDLATAVARIGWPTPQARDGDGRGPQAKRYTDTARSYDLPDAVAWATPTRQDGKNHASETQRHRKSEALNVQAGGALNPAWVEWLMGWPIGWTSLEPLHPHAMARAGRWFADPADGEGIPRTCKTIRHRRSRLMAIGNGIVPQAMVAAVRILRKELEHAVEPAGV